MSRTHKPEYEYRYVCVFVDRYLCNACCFIDFYYNYSRCRKRWVASGSGAVALFSQCSDQLDIYTYELIKPTLSDSKYYTVCWIHLYAFIDVNILCF